MVLAINYDPDKSLEEQITFPLEIPGLKLSMSTPNNKGCRIYRINTPDNPVQGLSPKEAIYLALLMKYGYVSAEELYYCAHNPETEFNNVAVTMTRIRRKIGKGYIKTRRASNSGNGGGGYYIGELKNHRNDPKNIVKTNGITCNTVTGYVQLPDGHEAYLTPLHTRLLEFVIANTKTGGITAQRLFELVYLTQGPLDIKVGTLMVHISNINQQLGEKYITNTRGKFWSPSVYRIKPR